MKMKSNQWPKVIGVLGILLGAIGTCSNETLLLLPKTTETQRAILQQMAPTSGASTDKKNFSSMVEQFDEMTKMESWFEKWCYIGGSIGVFTSLFYIFASIWMILLKQTAVRYFYLASAADILFSLIKGIVGLFGPSALGTMSFVQSLVGIGFVALLLIITSVSDKAIFREEAKPS